MLITSNATKITAIISEHKKQYYKKLGERERERHRRSKRRRKIKRSNLTTNIINAWNSLSSIRRLKSGSTHTKWEMGGKEKQRIL